MKVNFFFLIVYFLLILDLGYCSMLSESSVKVKFESLESFNVSALMEKDRKMLNSQSFTSLPNKKKIAYIQGSEKAYPLLEKLLAARNQVKVYLLSDFDTLLNL